ncbi:MAG: hypothetical protein ACKPKO_61860, partial [Candidatus Fonsibacter sp.]
QLIFQFITPHASDMLDPRNVVRTTRCPSIRQQGSKTFQVGRTGDIQITMWYLAKRRQNNCIRQAYK